MVPGTQVSYRSPASSQAEVLWFESYLSVANIVAWLGQKKPSRSALTLLSVLLQENKVGYQTKAKRSTTPCSLPFVLSCSSLPSHIATLLVQVKKATGGAAY